MSTASAPTRLGLRALIQGGALVVRASWRAAPWLTIVGLVLSPAAQVMTMLGALWLALLTDAVIGHNLAQALVAAGLMAVSAAAFFVVYGLSQRVSLRLADLAGVELDRMLVDITTGIPTIEHHERPEYLDRLERLRTDGGQLHDAVNSLLGVIISLARAASAMVLLGRLDPLLLLLPLLWIPQQVAGAALLRGLSAFERASTEEVRVRRHLETLATSPEAAKEVLVSNLGPELLERHRGLTAVLKRRQSIAHLRGTLGQMWTGGLAAIGYAGAIALVAYRATQGEATAGDVLMTVYIVAQIGNALAGVVFSTSFMLVAMRRVADLAWLLDYAAGVARGGSGAIPREVRRGIRLSDVSFRYPGTERWILRDLDLELPAGSVVALVGENGAGKTSLVKLLGRMYDPTEGNITIDGADIAEFAHEDWRTRLAAGYQDFVRFEMLAQETVGVGDLPRIEDGGAALTALDRAGASGTVESLPAGLRTQLGRQWGGVDLSGGQWQRLALGRALMRDGPLLLVLDEPTSALDAPTEHALFERFAGAARRSSENGMITVFVSHRFSTVRMADLIVVLEGGRITEVGSHEELLRAGGLYADLYEIQARAYR